MKTSLPINKPKFVYTAKVAVNYYIILGLYNIEKAKAANKKVPLLPAGDSRKSIICTTTVKSHQTGWKQQLTEQLHSLTSPFFKRTAV